MFFEETQASQPGLEIDLALDRDPISEESVFNGW